jgi:UDP-3-O-[3-hydroxymyristoyl] glucosamine N-acyltransferase
VSASRLTSGHIADLVRGILVGREDVQLAGVASLELAGPSDLTFLASNSHLTDFRRSNAGAVLVTAEFAEELRGPSTRIVVTDLRLALARAVSAIMPKDAISWGVDSSATVGQGARWQGRVALSAGALLGKGVTLGCDCVIGRHAAVEDGAVVGDECVIGAHAVVGRGAVLGNRVVLKPGSRVGGVGFAFAASGDGHVPIGHVGRCLIGDDVEVGSNTTIDRGSIADTIVGAGTKIDNLVQIAHNVRIGSHCLIMAQAGLAGSTVLEDDVWLAGQAGLAGHLKVGRGARVAAQAGVIGDVDPGSTVSGYPARTHREVLRQTAALRKLTRLTKSLERIVEADGSR